jgi:hypothetical protein
MMPIRRRCLRAAAFLGLLAGAAALSAQQTETVGPESLKDFTLPGTRTTPPAPAPQPAPPPAERPAPAQEQPKAAQPRPKASPPAATPPVRPRAAPPTADLRPVTPAPAPAIPEPVPAPAPAASAPQPAPAAASPAAAPLPPAEAAGSPWAWAAIPAMLALLGGAALFAARRRARPRRNPRPAATAGAPAPAPAPEPVAAGPEARLSVAFVPARAAATETAAVVEFELVLTNTGEAEARNIRIDTRMFNAAQKADIAEFVKGPIHEESGSPHVTIPPGGDLRLQSAIGLPKEELREIEMAGRRVFVPVVASIVAWDWEGGGTARTSLTWLVGREPEQPGARMGAFRLDLGPRIYRHVGVREMTVPGGVPA